MPTSLKRREQRKLLRSSAPSIKGMKSNIEDGPQPTLSSQEEIALVASIQPEFLKENPDFQLRGVEGKGRGLFYCPSNGRNLPKGSTMMRLEPEMMVPDEDHIIKCCHVCFSEKSSDKSILKRCLGCKLVRYCSSECKEADEFLHKKECKAIVQYTSSHRKGGQSAVDPGERVRLLARLVWQRKKLGEEWWKKIDSLLAHQDEAKGNIDHLQVALVLADYLGGAVTTASKNKNATLARLGYPSVEELRLLYDRFMCSSFHVVSQDLRKKRGCTLSNTAAMMNHSCSPNTFLTWFHSPGNKTPLQLINSKDLKAGDEVTFSYTDVTAPYRIRQTELQSGWHSKCHCVLCEEDQKILEGESTRVDPREALWCGRGECSGFVALDWATKRPKGVCNACMQPCNLKITDVASCLDQAKTLLELSEKDKSLGTPATIGEKRSLIKTLTGLQPPSSYPLLGLLHQSFLYTAICSIGMELNRSEKVETASLMREESIRLGLSLFAGLQIGDHGGLLPEGHPERIGLLLKLSMMVKKRLTSQEAQWVADYDRKSEYVSRAINFPPPGYLRDMWGDELVQIAFAEIKIGFGEDAEKSDFQKALKDALAKETTSGLEECLRNSFKTSITRK